MKSADNPINEGYKMTAREIGTNFFDFITEFISEDSLQINRSC